MDYEIHSSQNYRDCECFGTEEKQGYMLSRHQRKSLQLSLVAFDKNEKKIWKVDILSEKVTKMATLVLMQVGKTASCITR